MHRKMQIVNRINSLILLTTCDCFLWLWVSSGLAGEKVPTMEQMELRLVQSKSDIENPQVIFHAEEI